MVFRCRGRVLTLRMTNTQSPALVPQPGLTPTERLAVRVLQAEPLTFNQLYVRTGASAGTLRNTLRCLMLSGIVAELSTNNRIAAGDRVYSIANSTGGAK